MQKGSGAGPDTPGDHSARVVNMLRGGILSVRIRKGMDMEKNDEDGRPSSARQVLSESPHMF